MTKNQEMPNVEMIPVDRITVLNPRDRNKKVFRQIVDSISKVGLKKPITVSFCKTSNEEATYELVCGQGRLEAFISLGQQEIPAIVVDVSEEDRLIMSLVEKQFTRAKHTPVNMKPLYQWIFGIKFAPSSKKALGFERTIPVHKHPHC